MASPVTLFLGWQTPMAQGVAKTILAQARKASPARPGLPLDLGAHRVLVPSQFAARLIREELAKAEASGVLLPKIETPETFLNWGDRDAGVATKEACLLTWMEVLTGPACDPLELNELFPENNGPFPGFTAKTAQPFAEKLMQLRDSLGGAEEPLDFLSISKSTVSGDDPLRWEQLHVLEKDYLRRLEEKGLKDHNAMRADLASKSYLPEDVKHVWLAGLIDPQPLLLKVLKRHLGKVGITVLLGCDQPSAGEGQLFNEWGIPNPIAWKERRVVWPKFESSVVIARDPVHALTRLEECLGGKAPARGAFAVAPCERERHPELIADRLRAMGADAVNPLGQPHDRNGLYHSVKALNDLVSGWQYRLLRKAMLQPNLLAKLMPGTDMYKMNQLMDTLSQLRVPQDLDEAMAFVEKMEKPELADPKKKTREFRQWEDVEHLKPVLIQALDTLRPLREAKPQKLLTKQLALAGTKHKETGEADFFDQEVAEALQDAVTAMKPESTGLEGVTSSDWINLALASTADKRFRRNLSPSAIHMPGWMEAPWEPSPHLIVFGLTDDLVPQAVHADAFMPSELRKQIGLAGPDQVFANAAFTLERLRRSRENIDGDDSKGRLDVIVLRHDEEGNGLRPSRLLFLADDVELISRTKHLFDSPLPTEDAPYWKIPEELKLRPVADAKAAAGVRRSISATSFKDLLEDPYEFWLKRFLGMRESSHDEVELDRAGYGTLIHSALEGFGKAKGATDVTDAAEIQVALSGALDEHFKKSFGSEPEPGLALQRETARERLMAFAALQQQLAAEGWQTITCEGQLPDVTIEGVTPEGVNLGKVKVGGRFDRLDFNPLTKTWRVYDYKTYDDMEDNDPQTKHVTELKNANSTRRPGFEFILDGKTYRWNELQLPVYYHNLRNAYGEHIKEDHKVEVGYIILPSEGPAQALIWEDYAEKFSKHGEDAIKSAVTRLLSEEANLFAPKATASKYPTLEHLKGRKPIAYMQTELLGKVETKPTTK